MTPEKKKKHIHLYGERTFSNKCCECGEEICSDIGSSGSACMLTKGHGGNHYNQWTGKYWKQK